MLAAIALIMAVPAAAGATNIESDRGLTAALPAGYVVIWPGSTTLTLSEATDHGGVATVEADPFPHDDGWVPVASGVRLNRDAPVELTVRPERNTRYRVRDDRGREVVVDQTVDLDKRLWQRRRCLSGETGVCSRGRLGLTVAVLVKGPPADVRGRKLVLAIAPDRNHVTRVRRYRLRRVSRNSWRARARIEVGRHAAVAIALSEPRRDAFGETPRRPGWDQEFRLS